MLWGIIAYQVLQQENPQTIDKVKAVLENLERIGDSQVRKYGLHDGRNGSRAHCGLRWCGTSHEC
jgi:hypothetical protein